MHDHDHKHEHSHKHDSGTDKLKVVLPHLLKHNREHVKDIQKWLKISEEAGEKGVAAELKMVIELFEEINTHLERALEKSGSAG